MFPVSDLLYYSWKFIKPRCNFSKLFRLERTDPLSFGPKFPEILLNGSRPRSTFAGNSALFPSDDIDLAMCPFRDFVGKQFHLFDVMWPRSNRWERALLGRNFQLYNNWHYSGASWVWKSAYLYIQDCTHVHPIRVAGVKFCISSTPRGI